MESPQEFPGNRTRDRLRTDDDVGSVDDDPGGKRMSPRSPRSRLLRRGALAAVVLLAAPSPSAPRRHLPTSPDSPARSSTPTP